MPVTQAQIDSAPDALALGKLQATIQNDGYAVQKQAGVVQAESVAAQKQSGVVQEEIAANVARQATAAEKAAAAAESMALVAQEFLTKEQEIWMKLYELHLKTRLGPSAITSATADSVMDDIVKDAVRMTGVAYPLVMGEVNKLAPAGG